MTAQAWAALNQASPVRIQWDPERDLHFNPLAQRSIQIGLSGPAAQALLPPERPYPAAG